MTHLPRYLIALLMLVAAMAALPGTAHADDPAPVARLNIDLLGGYGDNAPTRAVAVGEVKPVGSSTGKQFTFHTNDPAGHGALQWTWNLGDGRVKKGTHELTAAYTRPGVYNVTVTVDSAFGPTSATGSANIVVYVSPTYNDITAETEDDVAAAEAAWTLGALGALPACGTSWFGSTATGTAEFCPEPVNAQPGAADPFDPPAGDACFTDPWNCGFPTEVFFTEQAAGTVNGLTPEARIKERLATLNLMTGGQVVYDGNNCEDGVTKLRDNAVVEGLEDGCLSYGDFLGAVAVVLDGGNLDDTNVTEQGCATAPAAARRGAHLLGVTDLDCDLLERAVRKSEAYALIAQASGLSHAPDTAAAKSLRDLQGPDGVNPPLYYPGPTSNTHGELRGQVGALLGAGVPLVGELSCPDRRQRQENGLNAGVCFNPGEALSRSEVAELLAALVHFGTPKADTLTVTAHPAVVETKLGNPAQLKISAYAPSWYAPDATVNLSWSATTEGGSPVDPGLYGELTCPSATAEVGSRGRATFVCTFAPKQVPAEGISLRAQVSADNGEDTGTADVLVKVENDPPVITGDLNFNFTEGQADTMAMTINYYDPEENPVFFEVSPCFAGPTWTCEDTSVAFERNNGKVRQEAWDDTAATAVGDVTLSAPTPTSVEARMRMSSPHNNGPAEFLIKATDSGGKETIRRVTVNVEPVNDPPVVNVGLVTATANWNRPAIVTLTGDDPLDVGQPGYPAAVINSARVCSVSDPTGWLVSLDGMTVTATPREHVGLGETLTITYQVRDGGNPGQEWSGTNCADTRPSATGQLAITVDDVPEGDLSVTWHGTANNPFVAGYSDPVKVRVLNAGPNRRVTIDWGNGTAAEIAEQDKVVVKRYPNGPELGTQLPNAQAQYPVRYKVTNSSGDTVVPFTDLGVVTVNSNRLSNPAFESNTHPWAGRSTDDVTAELSDARGDSNSVFTIPATAAPNTVAIRANAARGGKHGLLVQPATDATHCVVSTDHGAIAGRLQRSNVYNLSFWYRNQTSGGQHTPQPVSAVFVERNAAGKPLRVTSGFTMNTSVQDLDAPQWRKYATSYTAKVTGTRLEVILVLPAEQNCGHLDDMAVYGDMHNTTNPYQDQVLADNPWAYWPLDEIGSGDYLVDLSGNRHEAGESEYGWFNMSWEPNSGIVNGSYQAASPKDAGGQHLVTPVGSGRANAAGDVTEPGIAPRHGDQWTFETWYRNTGDWIQADFLNSRSGYDRIFSFFDILHADRDPVNGQYFTLHVGGPDHNAPILRNRFYFTNTQRGQDWYTTQTFSFDEPLHVVAHLTQNHTGENIDGPPKLYVNGELVPLTLRTASSSDPDGTTHPAQFRHGRFKNLTVGNRSKGIFDEAAVYNYALPENRIQEHYNIGTRDVLAGTMFKDNPSYVFTAESTKASDAAVTKPGKAAKAVKDGTYTVSSWIHKNDDTSTLWRHGVARASVDHERQLLTVVSGEGDHYNAELPTLGEDRTQVVVGIRDGKHPTLVVNGVETQLDATGVVTNSSQNVTKTGAQTAFKVTKSALKQGTLVHVFADRVAEERTHEHYTYWWLSREEKRAARKAAEKTRD